MFDGALTTGNILDIFTEEIQNRGGRVTDTFHDNRWLFVRSLLPYVADARPKDQMQGGVALRATEDDLSLHPYLFRQVCRNGAIMAQAIESLEVDCLGVDSLDEAMAMLRKAIGECSEEHVFARSIEQVRALAMTNIDHMLNLIPHLSRLPQTRFGRFFGEILNRFLGGRDRTQFGFMNAVTSVARDEDDPENRWRLEELGGDIGALLRPRPPSDAPSQWHTERDLAPVG